MSLKPAVIESLSVPRAPEVEAGTKVAARMNRSVGGEPAQAADAQAVRDAARHIEVYLRSIGRELEFRVDGDTGRTVVTVRDTATGDVIRQIPGEEALRLARHLVERGSALLDVQV